MTQITGETRSDGERVAILETELKFFQKQCDDFEVRITGLESRLTDLEKKKERLLGAIGVVAFIWPFVSHKIGELLGLFTK